MSFQSARISTQQLPHRPATTNLKMHMEKHSIVHKLPVRPKTSASSQNHRNTAETKPLFKYTTCSDISSSISSQNSQILVRLRDRLKLQAQQRPTTQLLDHNKSEKTLPDKQMQQHKTVVPCNVAVQSHHHRKGIFRRPITATGNRYQPSGDLKDAGHQNMSYMQGRLKCGNTRASDGDSAKPPQLAYGMPVHTAARAAYRKAKSVEATIASTWVEDPIQFWQCIIEKYFLFNFSKPIVKHPRSPLEVVGRTQTPAQVKNRFGFFLRSFSKITSFKFKSKVASLPSRTDGAQRLSHQIP